MNAYKLRTSVGLEHAVIMTMECFMNVHVKMEQQQQEPVPMAPSHVLVSEHFTLNVSAHLQSTMK